MIHLTKKEKRSIYDCLTWWVEKHKDWFDNRHPRKLEWLTELAIREARRGPGLAPDYCAQPKRLKGRCRGCWYAGDPTMYDSGGCMAAPDVDPYDRERVEWRATEARKGRRYLGQELWSADPED